MTILDKLAENAHQRVEAAMRKVPLKALRAQAEMLPSGGFVFEKAL